jgi:hypothetical protein
VRLFTSRYQNKALAERDDLVKVRTTVGRPRFRLGYDLTEHCRAITPYGLLGKEGGSFTRAYRKRLNDEGVEKIRLTLTEISARNGGRDLVLLCFEDVHKLGEAACHRRAFARWWQEETGDVVEELPADDEVAHA